MRRRLIRSGVRAGSILLALAIVLATVLTPVAAQAAPIESASATVTASSGCVAWHTVRPGDNLTRISRWYGVSVWQIAQVNGIHNPSLIFIGQVLCIPSTYSPPGPVPPRPPGPVPPVWCSQFYTVQFGDTLSRIARNCGTTVNSLMYLNGIYNPNLIRAGQVLRIF
ncbi:MAG: LysM peptidoglycan-binding domain-containing protein [Caldilinea sp.]|mgnify:CR=1 FL=1|uniref:LysM peptidoglycan-binding domain-containing protein n=1 Tax=Caldilinea sp. TaxID=2293560 RepID=UPI002B86F54C|nr:LysM peptidoglycan-binding domain-containing protein [Caldilinea sp.]HRA66161.1 LysM peptidoglycan-binding domain-containing protein [Caldilinea sp.]